MNSPQHLGAELAEAISRSLPSATFRATRSIPATGSQTAPWPAWVSGQLKDALGEREIFQLYTHQQRTAELAWQGTDVVVATGTSSGKSLAYQLPAAQTLLESPQASVLYLTPTKALGQDQLHSFATLLTAAGIAMVAPATYDGDTPAESRRHIRDHARFIVTNPDMLHAAILPGHARWTRFLRSLRFIIIDECHAYRGVFGAHVALVLRRLLRLAEFYGAHPTVILASATAADPADQASRLTGRTVTAITEDGSPSGTKEILLWEPGITDDERYDRGTRAGGSESRPEPPRRSTTQDAAAMMATLIAQGARTLTFVRSRQAAEYTALNTAEQLALAGRVEDAARIASYRAGYTSEDRRAIERALDNGELLGLATTSALELGIDVGGLDAVISAGFPGTMASFWQQAGRAGRRGQSSLAVLIARDEPMDTYLVHHPEFFLGRPIERNVFNPRNPYILRGHLLCAALERPLSDADLTAWGARDIAEVLREQRLLAHRARGWFATLPLGSPDPHQEISLRGTGGHEVTIVDASSGRLLGTVDASRALSTVFPGAVYLHMGESYVVDELDVIEHLAIVHPEQPNYRTRVNSTIDIQVLDTLATTNIMPGVDLHLMTVLVSNHVHSYAKRYLEADLTETIPLDFPPEYLETTAVAYTIDPLLLTELEIPEADWPGTLHAAEHAAIGLLPLIATCDRWDIGGVSTALHADTAYPTVFVYDGYPGGAGFAETGYLNFHRWITTTYQTVSECDCLSGCPRCVQSPKCGNGNNPLDKEGAASLLQFLSAITRERPSIPPAN